MAQACRVRGSAPRTPRPGPAPGLCRTSGFVPCAALQGLARSVCADSCCGRGAHRIMRGDSTPPARRVPAKPLGGATLTSRTPAGRRCVVRPCPRRLPPREVLVLVLPDTPLGRPGLRMVGRVAWGTRAEVDAAVGVVAAVGGAARAGGGVVLPACAGAVSPRPVMRLGPCTAQPAWPRRRMAASLADTGDT